MTVNPWKPPSGWDRDPQHGNDDGPWTVGKVLRAMGRAFRKQPLGVLLAVCVFPGLWTVPATIADGLLVPESEPIFGPGRSLRAAATSFATTAWASVWFAGQLTAAIDAVRGRPIQWRAFTAGLSRAPILFLASAVILVPFELASLIPVELPRGEMFSAFDWIGLLLLMYVSARTCLWAPILVDARRSFREGLAESWAFTWGVVGRLFLLAGILITSAAPIAFVEVGVTEHPHIFLAVLSALYTLAVAAIYTFVYPEPAPGQSITPPSSREP